MIPVPNSHQARSRVTGSPRWHGVSGLLFALTVSTMMWMMAIAGAGMLRLI